MRLIAELTMPGCGSWNGQWSGAGDKRTVPFSNSKKTVDKIGHYSYNFGDGWRASIEVREAKPREKVTNRFAGYEWMVTSIKTYGDIVYPSDRAKKETTK